MENPVEAYELMVDSARRYNWQRQYLGSELGGNLSILLVSLSVICTERTRGKPRHQ